MEPLKTFFDHTPNDQVSYIILRHLPPAHQSALKQILTRHSRLEVIEAADGMRLEINKVYLPPSHKYLVIEHDIFHLVDRPETGPNRAVDVFMQSLAWGYGTHAIGVILSGAGNDGVKGTKYIKEAGGMTIAQEPSSCEHASMPDNAIRAGNIDYTALPHNMPGIILRHVIKK